MKRLLPVLLLLAVTIAAIAWLSRQPFPQLKMAAASSPHSTARPAKRLREKAREAQEFAARNGYSGQVCFLIDMSLPSGRSRFFVYDFPRDSIRLSGLVTHGNCNQRWLEGRKYGNDVGCGCTSLGKYRVGTPYYGRFGLAFKLHGLETSNANAFARYVVLHAHECVPAAETPDDICQSNGCPTVSPSFLKEIEPVIKRSPKPVLLWIYN